jgi:hypothetical protein
MGLHLYVQHVSISRLTQYIEEVHIDGLGSLLLKRGGHKKQITRLEIGWWVRNEEHKKRQQVVSVMYISMIHPSAIQQPCPYLDDHDALPPAGLVSEVVWDSNTITKIKF